MILKASEFRFLDAIRTKFYMIVRATPPEGWPRCAVIVSEGKIPYKNFLQIGGAAPNSEYEAQIGEYPDNDPRIVISMLEEIAFNCPLKDEEAEALRNEYQSVSENGGEARPPLFVQGLMSSMFHAFESGALSFPAALSLSLYTSPETQREIVQVGSINESPEIVLENFADPFYAGDILNRLAREPGRFKVLGCDNFRAFLKHHAPFSYGRSRFLMRLAAEIPVQKRDGLTSDHGELLLNLNQRQRESVFRGGSVSIGAERFDFKQLVALNRQQTRNLIRMLREEKRGTQA